jgi:succinate-semialdehyde dehydrogenase/glutarate-semialdehyde dehydrogenase
MAIGVRRCRIPAIMRRRCDIEGAPGAEGRSGTGAPVSARSGRGTVRGVRSINPTDGRLVAEYPPLSLAEVHAAIDRATKAQGPWAETTFAERGTVLAAAADRLEQDAARLAHLMAVEMGKPLGQGRAELTKCASACRYYAEHAERFLADVGYATQHARSYAHHEPLGVVLAVMPWNFPFWQVFRFAAPALMAGNVGLLKHASNVAGCAVAIAEVFQAAGAPEGVFQTLLIGSDLVDAVLEHPGVAAATLTGSAEAGRAVASKAGSLLKKTVLELGGSDPYVVLEDADIERAAKTCADSRMINSGQSCISAKRFIVVDAVHDAFVDAFVARMADARLGDPTQEDTAYGPLARTDLRDDLQDQVARSVAAGARLVLGGAVPEGPGAFYPPTVLLDVEPGMAAFDEETFGPVAAVVRARDADHAVELANTTVFGLGAAVFTQDLDRGADIAARRLRAGNCFVNALVASDPRLPFGGVKESGYGRELSDLGIKEFVNTKTVVVAAD